MEADRCCKGRDVHQHLTATRTSRTALSILETLPMQPNSANGSATRHSMRYCFEPLAVETTGVLGQSASQDSTGAGKADHGRDGRTTGGLLTATEGKPGCGVRQCGRHHQPPSNTGLRRSMHTHTHTHTHIHTHAQTHAQTHIDTQNTLFFLL